LKEIPDGISCGYYLLAKHLRGSIGEIAAQSINFQAQMLEGWGHDGHEVGFANAPLYWRAG
jgi:hypothetical protein